MNALGSIALLVAFVGSGYAAFACFFGWLRGHRGIGRSGAAAALASVLLLTAVTMALAWALVVKDFHFAYVAQYCNLELPWYYSLSALWVGQAGSLLLWAWLLGVLALAYRFWPRRAPGRMHPPAFGILMAYVGFLVAAMVFGADPMEPSIEAPREGLGLDPLLQHPAMLIHPPLVLLGYAGWAVPFALAISALAAGGLDASWIAEARRWALFAWTALGAGILLGAVWAYEELGWGGYWSWDPVENGSLIPWLTGTALIHTLMTWQYRGGLKKTSLLLAIITFALCNFGSFLTRSGIFTSLHAFSQSPIGWMFLGVMVFSAAAGGILVFVCRARLSPEKPIRSLWQRETLVLLSTIAMVLMASATLGGTLVAPASDLVVRRAIVVGPPFYNHVLVLLGVIILAATGMAPVLRWGNRPTASQKRTLFLSAGAGGVVAAIVVAQGVRHPVALAVSWLAALAVVAALGALIFDARRRHPRNLLLGLLKALRASRREYSGFLIHLGFVCLAIGITGSTLGSRRRDTVMSEGQTVTWAGRSIRLIRLIQRELPGKVIAEAELEISRRGVSLATLLPAKHLHLLQNKWTTEVAIHSAWSGDFYTIAHGPAGPGRASLTMIVNPMIRWLWLGGWVAGAGVLLGLWPTRPRFVRQSGVPAPKGRVWRPKQHQCAR